MNGLVIDCSALIQAFILEVDSQKARNLVKLHLLGHETLHAPDLIVSEVGNVLWKRVQRNLLDEENAKAVAKNFLAMNLVIHPSFQVFNHALELSFQKKISFYDALYAALSQKINCPLITADEKLYIALQPEMEHLKLLSEVIVP